MHFQNRVHAGKQLAHQLQPYKNRKDTIVLGLPRGGVVVAFQVAQDLVLPLDVVVPRKIGAPDQPELAVGAIAQDGSLVWNQDVKKMLGYTAADLAPIIDRELAEANRRLVLYRGNRPPLNLKGKIVILVDDGIATGATMRAGIASARALGAQKIIVAVPVASSEAIAAISHDADEVVCLSTPDYFPAIGMFYEQFAQTTDEEVIDLLAAAKVD